METPRRTALKKLLLSSAGVLGFGGLIARGATTSADGEKVAMNVVKDKASGKPLFSGITKHNGLVFLSGIGAHFEGDITSHTLHVLEELKKKLEEAGSSMDKVLKVSVFLNDIADYDAMNKAYSGKFGGTPPVRTTVAVAKGGVPGNSLVEIDCIAYT
jgi:enamine deaminase RidA (YjgF/YER057c/UK114 family)